VAKLTFFFILLTKIKNIIIYPHCKMKISDIINYLEELAPNSYQESYDNSGLIVGNQDNDFKKGMVCFDITENTLQEAIDNNMNLIISHHPFLFHSIRAVTGKTLVERLLIKAIKHDISIYAMHTNLDNVYEGVNHYMSKKLLLNELSILRPQQKNLKKIITYVPDVYAEKVRNALFDAGGGKIGNYDSCSFNLQGMGTFKANEAANPFVGQKGKIHFENEIRMEMIFPAHKENQIIKSLLENHPYEEPAYDIYLMENQNPMVGSGMKGMLNKPVSEFDFLNNLKTQLDVTIVMHSNPQQRIIKQVAFCGGSGAFLIPDAIKQKADVFVTGEIHYHDFINFADDIFLVSIGHYESEHAIKHYLCEKLIEKFTTFAVSKTETNPVNYLY